MRFAFTLPELLVVIAIIGLLLSLLASAVQKARETANRLNCNNNLRQIGSAFSQREVNTGRLPKIDWPSALLPFIEQEQHVASSPIKLYLCPSRSPMSATKNDYTGGRLPNSAIYAERLAAVTDGLSNTMLLGERRAFTNGGFPIFYHNWDTYDLLELPVGDTAAPDRSADGWKPVSPTDTLGFGSHHLASMNLLMCDGSVRRFPYGLKGLEWVIGRDDGKVFEIPE
jgi:prepilin-type N-terminal cleavage/methylation domain-containing protein